MSFKSDTVMILGDTDGTLLTIKRITFTDLELAQVPVPRSGTLATVSAGRFQIFPVRTTGGDTGQVKDERGEPVVTSHRMYGPRTSSVVVSVDDRMYDGDSVSYYDVKKIDEYEDHIRVWGLLVEGR